ncbi:MAG: molybdopterin molybdotransferase MoeA [Actinomycetia bacterium]|nr:molybdopterin molybdotransferase MoeA [Actinomycetes bacterium]
MIPLDDAKARVFRDCHPLPVTEVALADADGLVLAEAVSAREDIPPFANTAMDGFAVRASDTAGATDEAPARLAIAATIPAGSVAPRPLQAGEAMRIMTGAPMPDGADAVIMVELTSVDGDDVLARAAVPVDNHVRGAGDDVRAGVEVLGAGSPLSAGHLGVLASLGCQRVKVHRRPRVGVISTGDELIEGPQPLGPGQIRDSNRHTLLALVRRAGCEAIDLGLIGDDEALIEGALWGASSSCDAVITSGGVSMGDFDYVKTVLSRIADMDWMQVAIKPAKPLAFGTLDGIPVFGLPGNPVSSMVSFELFARPGLRRMMGHPQPQRQTFRALAVEGLPRRPDGKIHFARVRVEMGSDGRLGLRSAGGQGSHQLTAMADADALAMLADGDGAQPGDDVEVILLDHLYRS